MKFGDKERGKKVFLDVLLSITLYHDVEKWEEREWISALEEELMDRQDDYKNNDILDLVAFYVDCMNTDDVERMVIYGIPWAIAFDILANNEIEETPYLLVQARK